MITDQSNCCFICKESKRLIVDHNHNTGEVRKLLCYGCNRLVGIIENQWFESALEYVKDHDRPQ